MFKVRHSGKVAGLRGAEGEADLGVTLLRFSILVGV